MLVTNEEQLITEIDDEIIENEDMEEEEKIDDESPLDVRPHLNQLVIE